MANPPPCGAGMPYGHLFNPTLCLWPKKAAKDGQSLQDPAPVWEDPEVPGSKLQISSVLIIVPTWRVKQ